MAELAALLDLGLSQREDRGEAAALAVRAVAAVPVLFPTYFAQGDAQKAEEAQSTETVQHHNDETRVQVVFLEVRGEIIGHGTARWNSNLQNGSGNETKVLK